MFLFKVELGTRNFFCTILQETQKKKFPESLFRASSSTDTQNNDLILYPRTRHCKLVYFPVEPIMRKSNLECRKRKSVCYQSTVEDCKKSFSGTSTKSLVKKISSVKCAKDSNNSFPSRVFQSDIHFHRLKGSCYHGATAIPLRNKGYDHSA